MTLVIGVFLAKTLEAMAMKLLQEILAPMGRHEAFKPGRILHLHDVNLLLHLSCTVRRQPQLLQKANA